MRIAFIGTGVMGSAMAENLLKAGFGLNVFTRTQAKADGLVRMGAARLESVAECVAGCGFVITMVGFPADVEEVYFGSGGIIANAAQGAVLVDMTTTSPALSERIYKEAKARGLFAVDAPVSGGDTGAKNGTLSIMAGGDGEAVEKCKPIFEVLGGKTVFQGGPGKGQHAKMCNQIALAGVISGVCEAIKYAEAAGLDPERMLDTVGSGAAGSWQMSNTAPRILRHDFAPGFFIRHFIKDMEIAREEAGRAGLELTVLPAVLEMYRALEKGGLGAEGTQALYKFY